MLVVYLQVVTNKDKNKKHHYQDNKYEEKNKRPIIKIVLK